MSNILKKVIMLITWIPKWILEVLGIKKPEMKKVADTKMLPKPKAKSRLKPAGGRKAALLLVQEVGKAIYLWKDSGFTQVKACAEAGIGTNFLYKNMKKHPRRCENLRKKYAKLQEDQTPIPKVETNRSNEVLEQMGRAQWLIQECGWLIVDACSEVGRTTQTYNRWRTKGDLDKALKAYISEAGKDKPLEANPRTSSTKVSKNSTRGKVLSKEKLGRAIWLVQDCDWVVTHVAQLTGVAYGSIWDCLKGRHALTSEECKKAYLKKVGKNKAKELPPTIRNDGSKGSWTSPETWGEYMYLVHVTGWTKAKALRKFGLNSATVLSVDTRRPGYLNACLELYQGNLRKEETKETDVSPEKNPSKKNSSGSGKAIKLKSPAKSKKVTVTTLKLTDAQVRRKLDLRPDVAWERLTEACLWQMVELMTPKQACKKARIEFSVYLEYKELNIIHKGESFRNMANEAEKHREASLLAKKEHERNKRA